jgi:magnesium chelatase family protein
MSLEEAIETTRIHSVAGTLDDNRGLVGTRPYRSPHHTISDAGLIGGGAVPRPGEVSLGHNGVLFLDELPEFQRNVLEVMRQPLEDGRACNNILSY